MFSPAKMTRLGAVLLKSDARAALRSLGAAGTLELAESRELSAAPGETAAPAKDCAALLERLAEFRRATGTAGAAAQESCLSLAEARAALEELERRAEGPLKRRAVLTAELAGLAAAAEKLRPYADLPLPSGGEELRSLYCSAGTLPAQNYAGLAGRFPAGAALLPLAEKAGRLHAVALGLRSEAPALAAALKLAGFQPEALPGRPGLTLAELAGEHAERLRACGAELEKTEAAIKALAAEAAAPLAAAERALNTEKSLLEAEAGLGSTGAAVLLSGWVPSDAAPAAAAAIGEASGGRCAVRTGPPGPGGDAPVLLRPPRLFRPFVTLVTTYGLPRYGEVEPTVFAALSFLAMFGMMFGDVGHGALVGLGGLLLALKGRGAAREAGPAVAACGVSSVFFGFLYGSCFGMEKFRAYALWRDPLEGDPMLLLRAALAGGAVVLSLGLILNIVNRLRAGDIYGAALGKFGAAGLAFYWAGLALAAGFARPRLMLPVMGRAVAAWLFREPALFFLRRGGAEEEGEGFAAVAAESLVGAFEGALLYLANTISFVRLAAYAMSHAALLAAAWTMREAADKVWGHGSAAGLLTVIAGNAVALGLEGLVAAVQALRLEYYEFFGKFFEPGGRAFRPFKLGI